MTVEPKMEPELEASLEAVGTVMAQAREPWWIIASAAVALHGADAGGVSDVDVLLGAADARRILPTLGVELRRGSPSPSFRSTLFGTWGGVALPVEFMADFHRRSPEGWLPVSPTTREAIHVRDAIVFVPCRAELQSMLTQFGRPKDLERARRLCALP